MGKALWAPDGSELPTVENHTKKKHEILDKYIHDWVVTICSNHRGFSSTLTVIDAFCGGGLYNDSKGKATWLGSPLRLIHSIEKGLETVKTKKGKPDFQLDIHFIFIDAEPNHISCLRRALKDYELDHYIPNKCTIITSSFSAAFKQVIDFVNKRKGHSFFLIDPFGYTDYTMEQIRSIMMIKRSEVLLNYMIDYIQRFLTRREIQMKESLDGLLEAGKFYRDINKYSHSVLAKQSYLRNETIRLFREQSLVKFAYSFGMITTGRKVTYYLIHLANNGIAQKVLKDALWFHHNVYQYQYEIFGLSYKTPKEDEELVQNLFNINEDNENVVIDKLEPQIMDLINGREKGISFKELQMLTMQENPANTEQYAKFIRQLRDFTRDIEIEHKGKVTKAQKIDPNDIIKRTNQKTFKFF